MFAAIDSSTKLFSHAPAIMLGDPACPQSSVAAAAQNPEIISDYGWTWMHGQRQQAQVLPDIRHLAHHSESVFPHTIDTSSC